MHKISTVRSTPVPQLLQVQVDQLYQLSVTELNPKKIFPTGELSVTKVK